MTREYDDFEKRRDAFLLRAKTFIDLVSETKNQQELAEYLSMSQPSVSRALDISRRAREIVREGLKEKFTRRMAAAIDSHITRRAEAEEELRRQATAREEAERLARERAERLEAERRAAEQAAIREAERLAAERASIDRAERLARERREARKRQIRDAFAPLYEAGIVARHRDERREFHGDARKLLDTDGPIEYTDEGALTVAGAPDGYVFECGLTAAQLREGVTMRQRTRKFLIPESRSHRDIVGGRSADVVPDIAHPDESWFFGKRAGRVAEWRDARKMLPDWMKRGQPPLMPGASDVNIYERVLEIESRMLREGLRLEMPCLGWGSEWTSDVEEKRSTLRWLKLRRCSIALLRIIGVASCSVSLLWIAWHFGPAALDWLGAGSGWLAATVIGAIVSAIIWLARAIAGWYWSWGFAVTLIAGLVALGFIRFERGKPPPLLIWLAQALILISIVVLCARVFTAEGPDFARLLGM